MKYQMINEELQIASCSIADLTVEQARHFFEQWGEDIELGTLTLFYDKESGLIVLNRDNKYYETYLDIAEAYLMADKEKRIQSRKEIPAGMLETLKVLENCIKDRHDNKWIRRALHNKINDLERRTIRKIIREHGSASAPYIAFRLGVIRGKRIERAKRKR